MGYDTRIQPLQGESRVSVYGLRRTDKATREVSLPINMASSTNALAFAAEALMGGSSSSSASVSATAVAGASTSVDASPPVSASGRPRLPSAAAAATRV